MSKAPESTRNGSRQIVGISLPPKTAADFKMEAARRQISLRKLFEEMWADYHKKAK